MLSTKVGSLVFSTPPSSGDVYEEMLEWAADQGSLQDAATVMASHVPRDRSVIREGVERFERWLEKQSRFSVTDIHDVIIRNLFFISSRRGDSRYVADRCIFVIAAITSGVKSDER
jgi:hypothetical protein